MRRRETRIAAGLIAVAALVTVVLVLVLSGGGGRSVNTERSLPSPPAEQYGAGVNRLFNDLTNPPAVIDAQLRALRAAGATVARSDTLWELVEPSPPSGGVHHYNWTFDDGIAGALARAGLRWLPIVDYSPTWAQTPPGRAHAPPAAPGDFAAFAAALARRYGPRGAFWAAHPELPAEPVDTYEIWNEPDNPFFWAPGPNPAAYGALYLQARAAIQGVDPSAQVIVGGLTNVTVFLPLLLRDVPSLRGGIDGLGLHPYGPTPAAVLAAVAGARRLMDSLGLAGVPIDITEFGWTTSPRGTKNWAPAALRPGYILQSLGRLGHTECDIALTVYYTWVTPGRNPNDPEDWFGIHPPGGGDSSDSRAFTSALAAARSAPASRLCG